MNKSDSERIAAVLENIGYKSAISISKANLIIVNMCSVRQSAVDRVYGLIPKFEKLKALPAKKDKKVKTVLTGCLLKKDKIKLSKLFDLVLGIEYLSKWPEILDYKKAKIISGKKLLKSKNYLGIKPKYSNKSSALVPIMTGCNNFCSYCVVPYTRGREISRPTEEIICEIKNLVKRGYKEIWLLGQNVNSYNSKLKTQNSKSQLKTQNFNFPELLKAVNKIPGDFWIRFTSSHSKDFSDELINAMTNCEKVTEYLNLPVQSGDNKILKQMNRPYTVAQYKNLVKKIRKKIPDVAISTDTIVGFPGETEKQFENTVKLFKEIKYDMAYINKYSPRTGTAAAELKNSVSQEEKKRREKALNKILEKTALEHNKRYIGKTVEVLIDRTKKEFLFGKTRTYKTVKFQVQPYGESLASLDPASYKLQDIIGKFVKVKITKALPWGLKGELI